ncbi:hypothetical protein VM1G_00676 [Cytospora mali]|uniref:Uncharacterized protein n=1 Tax=Cytospora mali TaxID=578113 RepID=A0A194VKL8_CYTMA|nr:hypothetical protein VM1G_00676 [Valsa mali]
MGPVQPIIVVGTVGGRRRVLGSVQLHFADPDPSMLIVAGRILTFLKENRIYLEHELISAAREADEVWRQDLGQDAQAELPKFPFVQTCLLLGSISSGWHKSYLHLLSPRPWNSAYNWGGTYMWEPGCLILDTTDLAYCFILPVEDTFHDSKKDRARWARLISKPLSGSQWLSAFGQESIGAEVRTSGTTKPAPVITAEVLREIWPSFPATQKKADAPTSLSIPCSRLLATIGRRSSIGKRNRDGALRDRNFEAIEELLLNGKPDSESLLKLLQRPLVGKKRSIAFLSSLQRYLQEYPEQFTAERPITIPLLIAALAREDRSTSYLELFRFSRLSGDQIVNIVEAIVAQNAQQKPLAVLDISFHPSVLPEHLSRILDRTDIGELIIWDNPKLPLDKVAMVARGRVRKVTTRDLFIAPFERWTRGVSSGRYPICTQPTPEPQICIRQVVFFTISTRSQADKPALSLEKFDAEMLAIALHPMYKCYHDGTPDRVFAEVLAFPLHDSWAPLAEHFTSLARIEEFMSYKKTYSFNRYPLVFPLMLAIGNAESEYVVTSPIPAEAFNYAWDATQGMSRVPLRYHGMDAIRYGEYTMILLEELDHNRLRYGLATRDAKGQLEVYDPADVDDAAAQRAWHAGIGRLPAWKAETQAVAKTGRGQQNAQRSTMLLGVDAVQTICAAVEELRAGQGNWKQIFGGERRGGCENETGARSYADAE